ncbi:MAG: PKD domain-containing protein [Bacteroidetes bacterium]|nr:PKD domain-containing protein [Bacteroidota bacterium]
MKNILLCSGFLLFINLNVQAQPVADFTFIYGNGGCTPDTVTFTNTSTGADSYKWNFGDGSPFYYGVDTEHVYTWASTFTVTLTAYDMMSGDSATVTKPVLVNQTPFPGWASFWTNPSSPVCPSTAIQFNTPFMPFPPTIGHLWIFGDDDSSNTNNPVHIYSDTGMYPATHIRYAQCGSDTATQIITIDSTARPTSSFSSSPNPVCPDQDINIWNSSQGATAYLWTFGDGDSSTAFNPAHSYSAIGNYTINLFAFNACGSDTFTLVKNVVDTITPPASAWVNDDSVCTNTPINFSGWSMYAVSYLWDFGDGNFALTQNAVHAYSALGTYTAVFTATNSCGKSRSFNLTVKVLNNLPPDYVNFWTTPSSTCPSSSGICPGTLVQFNNTSSDLGTSYWNFGDGFTSTQNNPTHSFAAAGSYNVKLVVTSSCGGKDSVTRCVLVKTDVVPWAWFCINPPMCFPSETVCIGSIVTFQNNSSDTSASLWDFGDGNSSTLVNPTHVYADTGAYTVSLTVTNPCGNSATSYQSIQVVTNGPPPDLMGTWANPTSVCPGQTVTFNGGAFDATSYKWLFGDGDSASDVFGNSIHAYSAPGNYTVTEIAYNGCGSDTGMVQVTVRPGPSPDFTFNVPCTGDTVFFTDATSPVPTNWTWDFGDGDTSSLQNPAHLFTSDGTFNVILFVSDSSCNSQVTKEVIAGINLNTSSQSTTCGLANGVATVNVISGHPPYTYLWNTAQTTSTITGLTAGTYRVTVADNASCIDSATVIVTNTGGVPSTAPSSASALPDTVCTGGSTLLTVSGGSLGTGASWRWHRDSCNGLGIGAGLSIVVSPVSTTTYFVRAEGVCNTTSCVSVTVPVVPSVTANAGSDGTVCSGTGYTLSGAIGGGAISGTWTTSGTGAFDNPALLNATYTSSPGDLVMGSVTLTLTTNDPPGPCPAASDAMILTINTPATAGAGADAVICEGSTYTLSGSRGGSATSSTWTTSGDGTFNNPALTNAIYTPGPLDKSTGSVTLTITTNDPAGPCPAVSDSMVLTINPAAFVFAGNDTVLCGGGAISITLNGIIGGGATSATWNTSGSGAFNNPALLNATYTPSNPDKAMGGVTLTLTTNNPPGPCAAASDALFLSIFPSTPSVTTSANNASCNGSCDGSADALVAGGIAPYTYQWDATAGSQTTSTATALCDGTYDITVQDVNGCPDIDSATVTEPALLSLATGSIDATCGNNDGSAWVTPSGGTLPYSYLWNDPLSQTNDTASALGMGAYSVTVTDGNGCTGTGSDTVNNFGAPAVTVDTVIDALCNGDSSGTVSVTASGSTPPYTYLWDDPQAQTGSSATGLTAGFYTVSITDDSSCVVTASVTVGEPTAISLTTSVISDAHCSQSDGEATVSASGGAGGYSYLWSSGEISDSASALLPGSNTVTVSDANGCSKNDSVTILNLAGATVSVSSSTDASCNGLCGGDAGATAAGGSVPYSYLWNTIPTQSSATATGLCAVSYEVVLTDGDNCTDTATVTINEPAIMIATATATSTLCNGSCDGTVTVNTIGGTPPYSPLWDDPLFQTDSTATGLCANAYSVTVTDNNGCTALSGATVNSPSAVTLSFSTVDATCGNSDGIASVTATGGTSPYTYLWNTGYTGDTLQGVSAGVYTVTVTDDNGCTVTGSATVNNAGAPSVTVLSTDVTCNGYNDGITAATVTGGSPPYTYAWSTGSTLASADSLSGGTYTVTLTDSAGCVVTGSATVAEPALLAVSIVSVTNLNCFGDNNGAVDISISGGALPYSIVWSTGSTSEDISNAIAGSYGITVTDNNGCSDTESATVTEPAVLTLSSASTDATCNAYCDGSADVTVSGGIAPYSYLWDDPSAQTSSTATGLCAGIYGVTLTDNNSCTSVSGATVNEPSAVTLSFTVQDATCGNADGFAYAGASGGNPPYNYLWDPSTGGQTTDTASALAAGAYSVTVTDVSGCVATGSAVIGNIGAPVISAAVTDIACNGDSSGMISVTATGGAPPLTYQWDAAAGSQTTAVATGLTAGTYWITVTDSVGCIVTLSSPVTEPPLLLLAVNAISNLNCYGNNNGSVDITVNGGTAPYTYFWSDGSTNEDLSNAIAGFYGVTVTDNNGCTDTESATVTEPAVLVAIISNVTNTSCGLCDGTADVSVSGGVLPYTYIWDALAGSQTTSTATGLCASVYGVTATDANGCTATGTASVTGPGGLFASISASANPMCYGSCSGNAEVTVSGGYLPYTYLWSDSQSLSVATGLCAGNSFVTVTDSSGCITTAGIVLTEPTSLSTVIDSINATCGTCPDGSADLTVSGGTPPYTYSWSNGDATEDIDSVLPAIYYVTVTDANGCTMVDSIDVDFNVGTMELKVSGNGLVIYPNPANDIVHIKTNFIKGEKVSVFIYSAVGKKVFTKEPIAGTFDFDLNVSGWDGGVYCIQVITRDDSGFERFVVLK